MRHVARQLAGLHSRHAKRRARRLAARRYRQRQTQERVSLEALEPRVLMSAASFIFGQELFYGDTQGPSLDHDHDCCCPSCTGPDINPIVVGPDEVVGDDTTDSSGQASFSLDETFTLHSNPGANHTIYLDFTGHTTENTAWNSWKSISKIDTPAYDIDGDVLSFSDNELTRIQNIFQRVAEDFIPFDVNVTTEEPAANDLIKSGSSDTKWGVPRRDRRFELRLDGIRGWGSGLR